jgi:hypothetical protein
MGAAVVLPEQATAARCRMVVEPSRLATPRAGPIFPLAAMLLVAEAWAAVAPWAAVGRRAVEDRSLLVAWTAGQAMLPLSAMGLGVERRTAVAEGVAGPSVAEMRAVEARPEEAPAKLMRIRSRIRRSPGTL